MDDTNETSMTPGPIWSAIAAALREEIAQGARSRGDKLPSEAQLAARFGVNRHTVRRALAELGEEGLVHARRGAGVFVTAAPTEYALGRRVRFHRNLEAAGRLPSRRMAVIETRPAGAAEARALGLEPGAPVHVSEGVSLADGRPLAQFRSVFPAARLPDLPEALHRLASVTAALTECGVTDHLRVTTRLSACLADRAQAALLKVAVGAALIRTESVNADASGHKVEYGITHFVGERVTLTLNHA